jgi:hypothetical protein
VAYTSPQAVSCIALNKLSMPGLTAAQGKVMGEAASVCLNSQGHRLLTQLKVEGDLEASLSLRRLPVGSKLQSAYGFDTRATDLGACGIALQVIGCLTNLKVLWEAKRISRFDYWMGSDPAFPFRGGHRVEFSGIRRGTSSDVRRRVKKKIRQLQGSEVDVPGFIVVVEFSSPVVWVVRI